MKAFFEISTDPKRIDIDIVYDFLMSTYWAKGRSREIVEQALNHSFCFGGYLDDKMIAFGRVVTDRTIFAYLMDIFVLPEYQGKGYGQKLLKGILDHPDLKEVHTFLLATLDAQDFYKKVAFEPLSNCDQWMERSKKC